jgi:hypothetical protein
MKDAERRRDRMNRRLMLCTTASGLAACASPQPADFGYAGSYDPYYLALRTADRNLSDLSRYRGRPADAARALAQFEFILAEMQDQVALVTMPAAAQPLLVSAQREVRSTLAIADGTPPRSVSAALRRFAAAADAGQQEVAMQALGQAFFTLGPQQTYEVLNNLPPMRALESVSSDLARAADTMQGYARLGVL